MLVSDITSQSLKLKNVAYMKKEQLEKIGASTAKRSSSSFFFKNMLKHEENFAWSCNGQCETDIRS